MRPLDLDLGPRVKIFLLSGEVTAVRLDAVAKVGCDDRDDHGGGRCKSPKRGTVRSCSFGLLQTHLAIKLMEIHWFADVLLSVNE